VICAVCAEALWRCPNCGDGIHPGYRESHSRICAVLEIAEASQVELLLEELDPL